MDTLVPADEGAVGDLALDVGKVALDVVQACLEAHMRADDGGNNANPAEEHASFDVQQETLSPRPPVASASMLGLNCATWCCYNCQPTTQI